MAINFDYDFSGWATKANVKCFDGLTIAPNEINNVVKGAKTSGTMKAAFGLTWQTLIGSDEDDELGFTLHLVWGATASPSERSHESYNDSPDAETFSWDCDTTPVKVTGYKPTAHMELDSTKVPQAKMEKLLNILYGTANTTPYLPLPDEVIKLMTT